MVDGWGAWGCPSAGAGATISPPGAVVACGLRSRMEPPAVVLAEVPPGAPFPSDDLSGGALGTREGCATTTPSTTPLGDGAAGIDQRVMLPPRATSPMTTRTAAESRHSRARETPAGSSWTGRGDGTGGCSRPARTAAGFLAPDDTPQLAASGAEALVGAATGALASAGCAARL